MSSSTCLPSAVKGVGMAIQRPLTFSRASALAGAGELTFTALILANDCCTVAVNGRDTDRAHPREEGPARRVARGVPRSLRPDASHPPVRAGDPPAGPEGGGARPDP